MAEVELARSGSETLRDAALTIVGKWTAVSAAASATSSGSEARVRTEPNESVASHTVPCYTRVTAPVGSPTIPARAGSHSDGRTMWRIG